MSVQRVAMLSVHTSPLAQPGAGDGGGMNVYVRSLASNLARAGVACDVLTRADHAEQPPVADVEPGFRVVHLAAGPIAPVPKSALPELVDPFVDAALDFLAAEDEPPDVRALLYVGRIQPLKGADLAVRALAELDDDVSLLVVGGPSGTNGPAQVVALRKLVADLGLERRVRFVPPQPHDQLVSYYQAADVC